MIILLMWQSQVSWQSALNYWELMALTVSLGFLQSLVFKGNCTIITIEGCISLFMLVIVNYFFGLEDKRAFFSLMCLRAAMHVVTIYLGLLQIFASMEDLEDKNELLAT